MTLARLEFRAPTKQSTVKIDKQDFVELLTDASADYVTFLLVLIDRFAMLVQPMVKRRFSICRPDKIVKKLRAG